MMIEMLYVQSQKHLGYFSFEDLKSLIQEPRTHAQRRLATATGGHWVNVEELGSSLTTFSFDLAFAALLFWALWIDPIRCLLFRNF
jgi:hypothetical protein